jgi:hypothetical protein
LDGFTITAGNANDSSAPIDDGSGGGIYNAGRGGFYGDCGSPTLINCTFIANSAAWLGGGIYSSARELYCTPILIKCTFIGNYAGYDGGGICNGHGYATFGKCNPILIDCKFKHNSSGFDGGGMYNGHNDSLLTNCKFTENSAGGNGGGMANHGPISALTNCIFSGNTAESGGAANGSALAADSYEQNYPSNIQVVNCILRNDGNEIYNNDNSTIEVTYSNVQGGWLDLGNIDTDPCFVDANNGDYHLLTGSLCINAGDPNYKVEPNETDFDGKPRLFRARIDMGAYELHYPGIIYVDSDAIGANDGSSWANAYNYLQDALTTAWNGDEIRVAQGIYKPDKTDYTLIDPCDRAATFKLKGSVAVKGGYAGFGESDPNARDNRIYQTILSGDLNGNDANVNDPYDLLTEPTRDENSYHVVNASATDSNALFDGFTVTGGNANGPLLPGYPSSDSSLKCGGAMYIDSGHANINNCTFIENSAFYKGGGIYNEHSNPMLTNCTFNANFGALGGGMSNYESNSTLTHCIYSGNSATYGGGIFNYLSNPMLTNCTFTSNMACPGELRHFDTLSGTGGGIFNSSFSSPTLMNCSFSGNLATGDAGGIFNFYRSDLVAINCTFNGNIASHSAGAMYNWRNSPTIANCTFSGNSANANGGSIYNEASEATLINCILWGDIATQGNEIYLDLYVDYQGTEYPSIMSVNYSDVGGGITGIYVDPNCTINWGDGNIDTDPCFVEPNNGDYHLKSQVGRWDVNSQSWVLDYVTSPCIDAANPGCPLGDEPAPNGNRRNMGAYGGTPEASKSPANWRSIADITNDWIVDSNDLKIFVDYWLETGECIPSDFDRSQFVDFNDFAILGGQWRQKGPGPGITYDIGDCIPVDFASSALVEFEPTRFTVTVEGRYIYFEDTMRANCCPEELDVQMTVEGDLITIYEIEHTSMPCPCLCDFPITATFGPFEPGTYIFAVYQNSSFIGITTVTIGPGS